MKIAYLIARYLLGALFTFSGLNGFFHFLPMPPPSGVAGQFMGALFVSHYLVPIFLLQLVGGLILLSGRYVPLGLVLLGPVLVNIVLFHALMAPEGLPTAIIATALYLAVFADVRSAFAPIFAQRV